MRDLIVVDNFYQDPNSIRDFALTLPKLDFPGAPYAGVQSEIGYYSRDLKDRFCDLLGEQISFREGVDVFGNFRISCAGDIGRTHVHFDSLRWSAVIYLTELQDAVDGTVFYSHKSSGLIGPQMHYDSADYPAHRQEMIERIVIPDSLNAEAWEKTDAVAYKFNRLVMFQGWQKFHSAGPSFGDSLETGRLTQQFFFESVQPR